VKARISVGCSPRISARGTGDLQDLQQAFGQPAQNILNLSLVADLAK
jgi:hypothetical protein